MTFPSSFFFFFFEYQRLTFYFSRSALFILESLFHPRAPDDGSAATAEVERHHGKNRLALKYLWFFSVVIVWVLTAKAHHRDPSPKQKAWCVAICCGLERWDKVHVFFLRALLLPPLPSLCKKDDSGYFRIDRHPFQCVVFFFICFFYSFILFRYFSSTVIFLRISSRQSALALSPLAASTSHSISHLISSTLSSLHHIHNDRLMAASASPLRNDEVTSIGPD